MAEMPVDGELLPSSTEEVAKDAPAVIEQEDISEVSSTEESDSQPKLKGVSKRISELTANWREEQRRSQQLQEMLDKVLSKDEPPAPREAPKATEPTLEQFKTYEEYVSAVADYRAELKVEQRFQRIEAERAAQEAARQKATVTEGFNQKVAAFSLEHPDFESVAFNPSLTITDVMADAINHAEKSPEILYYLGNNPKEAQRIAALRNPISVAYEIGRLERGLSIPQPRTTTNAPPPIRPLDGGSGSMTVDPEKMTADEWRKWRDGQARNR